MLFFPWNFILEKNLANYQTNETAQPFSICYNINLYLNLDANNQQIVIIFFFFAKYAE